MRTAAQRSLYDIEAEDGDRLQQWMGNWVEAAPPDGESFTALCGRVVDWLDDLRGSFEDASARGATIVVVAHAGPIRAVLCHVLDVPLDRAFRFQVDCAGVSTLRRGERTWTVVCLNATRFRRPADP